MLKTICAFFIVFFDSEFYSSILRLIFGVAKALAVLRGIIGLKRAGNKGFLRF